MPPSPQSPICSGVGVKMSMPWMLAKICVQYDVSGHNDWDDVRVAVIEDLASWENFSTFTHFTDYKFN